ncbi:MAG: ATP-dependent helicase [Deltaproteobacteria bacterium]|nr:ATP-dependent helicase [Deltaproteobacteria bacterium]
MRLTTEQKQAVRWDKDAFISACPGSGKTRVIISKLVRTMDEVRGTPRMVGCITYTNTAVHEIEARLRHHSQPGDEDFYDVCTIHSFCLNHIFRPFCHLIKGYKQGFKVLTPDSKEFANFVTSTCDRYGRYNLNFQDIEEFSNLRMSPVGEPVGYTIERGAITPNMAKRFWKTIRYSGFVDFANIIYYSLLLLQKRAEIQNYIASKFAWILVDEFQDTSDLQVEILSLIADLGRTRFYLVGDPFQSIFQFAGARPDLADNFANRIGARTDLPLSGNFRSSQPMVEHAELIFPRIPPMSARGEARHYIEQPQWRHGHSSFEVLTDYFLPGLDSLGIPHGNSAVLAPTWFTLFPLGRKLREFGISIFGPGARPYRRNRQFAPLAEQICGYLMESNPDSIIGIERTLFNTLLDITGRANFSVFSYKGRVVVFRLLEKGSELYQIHMGAVTWLESAADAFSDVLIDAGYLTDGERQIFSASVEEMKADMKRNRVDLPNLGISDLGIYSSPNAALKLSTIHNAKGREYDAVAMIDVHEGRLPSYYAKTPDDIAEQKRLFYVGTTRAKRFLLYVTDDAGRNGPSRFLQEIKNGFH